MSSISDYTFNGLTRMDNDACTKTQDSIINSKIGNYQLTNFNMTDCNMDGVKQVALSQPFINYTGPHNIGNGGCNIDINSKLMIHKTQTNPPCKLTLNPRQFLCVPYLGRGQCNVDDESVLRNQEHITNKKSITTTSDKSHIEYRHYPLVDSIQSTVTNPDYLVEESVNSNWIRGGLPTRNSVNDN